MSEAPIEDHGILDDIVDAIDCLYDEVSREGESVEFYEYETGRRMEIVVREVTG